MKLGSLKTTIRDLKTAPKVQMRFGTGHVLQLDIQKGPLLVQLDEVFPGGRTTETGLAITPDGYLTMEAEDNVQA